MAGPEETAQAIFRASIKLKKVAENLAAKPLNASGMVILSQSNRDILVELLNDTAKLFDGLAEALSP